VFNIYIFLFCTESKNKVSGSDVFLPTAMTVLSSLPSVPLWQHHERCVLFLQRFVLQEPEIMNLDIYTGAGQLPCSPLERGGGKQNKTKNPSVPNVNESSLEKVPKISQSFAK